MYKFGANLCERNNNLIQLMFTTACNNGCPYCINRFAMQNIKKPNVKKMVFLVAKQLYRHVVKEESVLVITGGEPCLFMNELDQFTKIIKTEFPYVKIVLQTSLPTTAYNNREQLYSIIERLEKMTFSFHAPTNRQQLEFTKSNDKFDKFNFCLSFLENLKIRLKVRFCLTIISKTGKTLMT